MKGSGRLIRLQKFEVQSRMACKRRATRLISVGLKGGLAALLQKPDWIDPECQRCFASWYRVLQMSRRQGGMAI